MTTGPIISAVCREAAEAPARPSLVTYARDGWRQASRRDVVDGMNRWAATLLPFRPAGGPPGRAVVILIVRHGIDAHTAFLGAMRAGMIACFIPRRTSKQDAALFWESHRAVFARIAPAVVLTNADMVDDLRAALDPSVPILDIDLCPEPDTGGLPPIEEVARDDVPALLQHSSGTTGLKKGVVLTHGQLWNQIETYASTLAMSSEDKVVSWLPLYHDMGLITSFLLPFSVGAMVISMDPLDWLVQPDWLLLAIARFQATLCWLPNFAFAHLVNTADDDTDYDLSSMRGFIDCSEPCRADTLEVFRTRFARHGLRDGAISTCYAMAETVFAVTQAVFGKPPRVLSVDRRRLELAGEISVVADGTAGAVRLVSCGPPLHGTSVRIAPYRAATPRIHGLLSGSIFRVAAERMTVGEIQVRSTSAFGGYHNDPAASRACMDGMWYRTGDLGFVYEGELYVSGRLKDLLIVNGRNFYAHDIEAVASSVAGIKPGRAVAFAVDRAAAGSDAAVVLAEAAAETSDHAALARAVSHAVLSVLGLSLHRVEIRPAGNLIKTTSGKLCRSENKRRFAEAGAA